LIAVVLQAHEPLAGVDAIDLWDVYIAGAQVSFDGEEIRRCRFWPRIARHQDTGRGNRGVRQRPLQAKIPTRGGICCKRLKVSRALRMRKPSLENRLQGLHGYGHMTDLCKVLHTAIRFR
jgi:hypothetical protein